MIKSSLKNQVLRDIYNKIKGLLYNKRVYKNDNWILIEKDEINKCLYMYEA